MASTYAPLPTTDEESPPTPKPRRKYRPIIVLALAFFIVALAAYKAGQWSIGASTIQIQTPDPNVVNVLPPSIPSNTSSHNNTSKPNSTDTTMHDHGKISVG